MFINELETGNEECIEIGSIKMSSAKMGLQT